jgi:hypothetical protein
MDRERLECERMLTQRARRLAVVGVLSLLVITTSTLVTASSTKRAEAVCSGSSTRIQYRYNGSTLVAEESVAYPGTTCNGDYHYSGAVLDPVSDGSCAYAYYAEPPVYLALQGVSCTTGSWATYGYTDTIGTNSVLVSLRTTYLADLWVTSWGY